MIKIVLTLFLFTTIDYANHIHWLGNYDKALSLAKKEHKPLIVLLTKNPCTPCHTTIKKVLMNQPYIDQINQKFISVIVTYEGRESYPIEMYYSTTFPTLFFVDSQTEHLLYPPLFGKEITQEALAKAVQ